MKRTAPETFHPPFVPLHLYTLLFHPVTLSLLFREHDLPAHPADFQDRLLLELEPLPGVLADLGGEVLKRLEDRDLPVAVEISGAAQGL
jgi:hypothetical protein